MSQEWYCMIQDREIGPFPSAQLKVMAQKGRLSPEDKIRMEGSDAWVSARKIRGLFPEGGPASAPEANPSPAADVPEDHASHPESGAADTPPADPPAVVRISIKKKKSSAGHAPSEQPKQRETEEEFEPKRGESPTKERDSANRERHSTREKDREKSHQATSRPKSTSPHSDERDEPPVVKRRPEKPHSREEETTLPTGRSDVHHEESVPDGSATDGFSFLDGDQKQEEPPPPPKAKTKSKHKAKSDDATDEVTGDDGPKSSASSSASGGLGFLANAYDDPVAVTRSRAKDASGRAKSLPKDPRRHHS